MPVPEPNFNSRKVINEVIRGERSRINSGTSKNAINGQELGLETAGYKLSRAAMSLNLSSCNVETLMGSKKRSTDPRFCDLHGVSKDTDGFGLNINSPRNPSVYSLFHSNPQTFDWLVFK